MFGEEGAVQREPGVPGGVGYLCGWIHGLDVAGEEEEEEGGRVK